MQQDDEQLICPEYLAYYMLDLAKQVAGLSDRDFNTARDLAEQSAIILSQRISGHDRETRLKSL